MRKTCILLIIFLGILMSGCTNFVGNVGGDSYLIKISQTGTKSEIALAVSPAIVGINGAKVDGDSVGSGVCVASGGYVLTNSHVVNGCSQIDLYLSDKSVSSATVIYEDPVLDLAILKSRKSMPYLALGSTDQINVGEDVLAVGTPLSLTLTHTFTKGIISALNRTLKVGSTNGEGYMQNLIQHDASLNPGNSGGPLLNLRGEVIGINTLKISSGEGIGFAIPTKSFLSLLSSFVTEINYKTPYLGVYGYDSEIANYYGDSAQESGFYVIDVADNSPLKDSGLRAGSVITNLNGKPITNTLDLKHELYKLDSSGSAYVEYYNDNQLVKTKTKLQKTN